MKKLNDEQRARLSAALKKKWASGTRKKNPPETYVKASETQRARYAAGVAFTPLRGPRCKEIAAMGGGARTDKQIAQAIALGKAKRGKRNPPGPSARGVNNWKAKFWMLWTPDRNLICGPSLSEIVRQNAHLFDPKYLKMVGSVPYAAKRLSDLFRLHRRRGRRLVWDNWHGWRAVDKAEMVKNVLPPDGAEVMWRPSAPTPPSADTAPLGT
jgi:hypothetical protein